MSAMSAFFRSRRLKIEVLQICNDALFAVMAHQGVDASIFFHGLFIEFLGAKGEAS